MNRLLVLFLRSRRVPLTAGLLAGVAVVLRAVKGWTEENGEFAGLLPLVLAVAAGSLVAASTYGPFGDPERATHPVRRLRSIQLALLIPLAVGLLGLARIGDDPLAAMRNVAGLTGVALLTVPVFGSALAWIIPLAYVIYCGGPIDVQQVDLLSWPALPSSNTLATVIALGLLTIGTMVSILTAGTRKMAKI